MKYVVEYEYGESMNAEQLNEYCEENQCELVTIVRDQFDMYAHYFRLI